jgi:hypothetical protein
MIRPSTWLRFHFEYSGDCAPRQISCRYGRTLSPCSWKPLGGTVVVKHIPYGMLRDFLFSPAFPSCVSTLSQKSILGARRSCFNWFRTRTTSPLFRLCPTSIARVSRVKISTIVKQRIRLPLQSKSATKSAAHTGFGLVGRKGFWRCTAARRFPADRLGGQPFSLVQPIAPGALHSDGLLG